MENRVIYSVTIAHDKEHWGTLRFLTDFFRFIGFFVYNFYRESPELKEIDTLIYLYINDDESIIADNKYFSIKSIDLSEEDKQTQISYLCDIIERIKNVNEDFKQVGLEQLAEIFVEKELMREINSINTFYKNKDLMQEAYDNFYMAYNDIRKLMEGEYTESKYVIYSRANCARYINEICNVNSWSRAFYTEKLIELLKSLVHKDSNFVNAYLLCGFIGDLDKNYCSDSIEFYQTVLQTIGRHPYSSYVYYRLARIYEKSFNDDEKAFLYYQKSYEVNRTNYRAAYKLGVYEAHAGHYEKSVAWFQKIVDLLAKRYESNEMHAVGYDYIYKAYSKLGGLYLEDLSMPEKALDFYCQLEKFFEKFNNSNSFYKDIYGDKFSIYFNETKERYNKYRADVALSKVYSELEDGEKSDFYWNKAKEEMKDVYDM